MSIKNAVTLPTGRSEVVQFPKRHHDTAVSININGIQIEPASQIRWLGVHLDPRLNFRCHVAEWCGTAMKVVQQMQRLNFVRRGAAPEILVRVMDTVVIPITKYGSEVWRPGLKRPTIEGMVTSQDSIALSDILDKITLTGLRAALPVLRTTPTAAV